MKYAKEIFRPLALALLILVAVAHQARSEVVDAIAAVVNGHPITRTELDRMLTRLQVPAGDAEARRRVLDKMVERVLVEQAAERMRVTVADAEMDKVLETITKRNNTDLLGLREQVERQGLVWEEYLAELRSEVLGSRTFSMAMRSDPRWGSDATDEDRLREFYLKNAQLFRTPAVLHLLHLMAPVESLEAMENIRARVLEGADFAATAQELVGSEPLNTGEMSEEGLSEPFRSAVSSVEVGHPTEILEVSGALHLLVVAARTPGRLPPFDEVREAVAQKFEREGQAQLFREWVEELRRNAVIDVRP